MKKHDWIDVLFWFCVTVLAFTFGCSITSCSVLHKNKSISKVDSVSVQKSHVDSSSKTQHTEVSKSNTESDNEIVFDFGDSQIVVKPNDSGYTDRIYLPENKDYFFYDDKSFSTNRPIKRVSIKGNIKINTVDSSSFLNHAEITKDWSDSTSVKSYHKDKEVKRSSIAWYWWLFLALIILYIIYRNRNRIKDFIIHKATGL